MPKCENCYHYEACLYFLRKEYKTLGNAEGFVCEHFKDKFLIVELPCVPKPLVIQDGINNGDIYCPECGTNLSGYYLSCEISVMFLMMFYGGAFSCCSKKDENKNTYGVMMLLLWFLTAFIAVWWEV